jgi:predicted NUDIX family phosphoesterase/predicted ATPase
MGETREENILNLEKLAQEVLKLKNQHRQRRPIVIEFCGSPKAGKTSSITSLNIFLKRNGFKTAVLTERASICPISDKQSPTFNVWTCTSAINEINERIDIANSSPENSVDIIICDRGIFDALCWFRWLKSKGRMSEEEYGVLSAFSMLYRWQKNIDLVYIFITTPEESIKREYANLLTNKRGSIMREDILSEYKISVMDTLKEYKNSFRATHIIDTTNRGQSDVGYEVTEKTLQTLKEMLMEKIGYFRKANFTFTEDLCCYYSAIQEQFACIEYGLRDEIESCPDFIQPIAVAVVLSSDRSKILCVKKSTKSTEKSSPEYDQTLLYVGGHMRKEDESLKCSCFIDIVRNTLEREIYEELGISVVVDKTQDPFVIYTPNNEKSKKHLAIGWFIVLDEDTKIRLDSYELIQKKGTSKSGTFNPIKNIFEPEYKLESWSQTILLKLLADSITNEQREHWINHNTQITLFD